jgi:aerobic-type carbon monoxide dehydrogenase small subunit (CoxS/CutS family)
MDGKHVLSCMSFAVMAERHEITTIEGPARPSDELHPMQQAFIDHDAFQCGYCTPGQIIHDNWTRLETGRVSSMAAMHDRRMLA